MNPQLSIAENQSRRRGLLTAAVVLLAGLAPLPGATRAEQATGPDGAKDLKFTITRSTAAGQLIAVPVNQGALVEFSSPIKEVRVANPAIADVAVTTPRQILINGKAFGTTQLIALMDGDEQRIFTIAVDLDLERLQASIDSTVPRAKVRATGMLDTVVLTGTVPDTDSAERVMQIAGIYSKQLINQMRVAGVQQVLLRVTVAEVNRTATRQLGFNGWMAGSNFQDAFAVSQIGGINPVNIGGAKEFGPITRAIPFATDQSVGLPLTSTPTLSVGFPRLQMQVFIKALRENGLLKVLAEPNLITVSGQEATFLAGGEFPVPVPQSGNSNAITIEYREFGVRLKFTPTVLGTDVIRLNVAPEVSEPDTSTAVQIGGFVVPGLTQRRVQTVVELGPGQTFAIGGLLSEKSRGVTSKIPGVGDIPVLGSLFSSVSYQTNETELVVLVTPELVEPLNPGQTAYVPGGNMAAPNDWELFLLGKLKGVGDAPRAAAPEKSKSGDSSSAGAQSPAAVRLRGPIGPAGEDEGT